MFLWWFQWLIFSFLVRIYSMWLLHLFFVSETKYRYIFVASLMETRLRFTGQLRLPGCPEQATGYLRKTTRKFTLRSVLIYDRLCNITCFSYLFGVGSPRTALPPNSVMGHVVWLVWRLWSPYPNEDCHSSEPWLLRLRTVSSTFRIVWSGGLVTWPY